MYSDIYPFMGTDALTQRAIDLENERNALSGWNGLAGSTQGKFLIAQINDKIQVIRGAYSKIPAKVNNVGVLLAGLQGAEALLVEQLDKLTEVQKESKRLDSEIELVLNTINERNNRSQPTSTSFVAEKAMQKEREKDNDRG